MQIEDYAARFDEEPGYLDFARFGPLGRTVHEELIGQAALLAGARFGSLEAFWTQDARVRDAVAALTGFAPEQITSQPSTSQGLMHVVFGLRGGVAAAASDFPSIPFAVQRAHEAGVGITPRWIDTDGGRLTPGGLRGQLDAEVEAVIVSLVDYRSGYLLDLEGIRDVIGERLLIVDAAQGFGVVDAPYALADVVVAAGAKWARAGWGTGLLALSDRALERLTPRWSGFPGTEAGPMPIGEVPTPARDARAYRVTNPDFSAEARLAAALEEIAQVGVAEISAALAEKVERVIELADEYALPVVSPRALAERAGIVALEPEPDRLAALGAALHNHGVTATLRDGRVRLAPHVSTDEESFAMLRAAFLSYSTAIPV